MNRGDIYRVRQSGKTGHEQQGVRYAVILQADVLLRLSTVIVAPTSRSAQPATFRPVIEIEGNSTRVLLDQLTTVDVGRLVKHVGRIDVEDSWVIDDAARLVLSL